MKHKYNVKAYKYKIIDIFESNFFLIKRVTIFKRL